MKIIRWLNYLTTKINLLIFQNLKYTLCQKNLNNNGWERDTTAAEWSRAPVIGAGGPLFKSRPFFFCGFGDFEEQLENQRIHCGKVVRKTKKYEEA